MNKKYHVVYWAYSHELRKRYIGYKGFYLWREFLTYSTSSKYPKFQETCSKKRIIKWFNTEEEARSYERELIIRYKATTDNRFANKSVPGKGATNMCEPELRGHLSMMASARFDNNPEETQYYRELAHKQWSDPGYRAKQAASRKEKSYIETKSKLSKKNWDDPDLRRRMSKPDIDLVYQRGGLFINKYTQERFEVEPGCLFTKEVGEVLTTTASTVRRLINGKVKNNRQGWTYESIPGY